MPERKFRIVHYLNQFFGGIGGEDKAGAPPLLKKGPIGPGNFLQKALGDSAEIAATVICGDNYFAENQEKACQELLDLVKQLNPDGFIAGPAFNAGRYGLACGKVCEEVSKQLKIAAVSGMYPENPGAEMHKKSVFIAKTRSSVAGMQEAVSTMAKLTIKLLRSEELQSPELEGYIPRGIRENYQSENTGAERAVHALQIKLGGGKPITELPIPKFDKVNPLPPIEDLSKTTIALVTSGGIVPKGNPDHIESSSASKFGKYSVAEAISGQTHQTAHGGYDPTYANENPNRVLPIDVMRELEKEKVIGKLYDFYYATVGNGTSVANAKKFGQAIAKELAEKGVQAVLITSN